MVRTALWLLLWPAFARADPFQGRGVNSLNEAATAEAHQRDDSATRAFSNIQIKTSDGKCLFVDKLSGDFRANLTPVQVADCGSTDGQGWDIITAGEHINGDNVMLIVSTLTQACFNVDLRQRAGSQVALFSCGGRADGGGDVTDSQLFAFSGRAGPLTLQPRNQAGSCLVVKGRAVDITRCNDADASQSFTIDSATASGGRNTTNGGADDNKGTGKAKGKGTGNDTGPSNNGGGDRSEPTSTCTKTTRTVTVVATKTDDSTATEMTSSATTVVTGGAGSDGGNSDIPTVNPTDPVPVSRAGGTLRPTAAAKSHQRDETATRAFAGITIRAPNGQCLFVDPTAGDFRQNLIPVSLVDCTDSPNEKWDIITEGKHNTPNPNRPAALIVSTLTQGCISFDGRRRAGDTVTLFSCGGRADGSGGTDANQLFPYVGQTSFPFAPMIGANRTCILPGTDRLESGPCPDDGSQLFSIFE